MNATQYPKLTARASMNRRVPESDWLYFDPLMRGIGRLMLVAGCALIALVAVIVFWVNG